MEQFRPQTAAEFWDWRVNNLRFYHGTSSHLESNIRQHGLSPQLRPYPMDEALFLEELMKRKGHGRLLDLDTSYISTSLSTAMEFAQLGSETIRDFIIPETENILTDPFYLLTQAEQERLRSLHSWGADYQKKHKPLLVAITGKPAYLIEYLLTSYPQLAPYLTERDAFIERVQQNLQATENMSEYTAAQALFDSLEDILWNCPIQITVSAEDFTIFRGKRLEKLRTRSGFI